MSTGKHTYATSAVIRRAKSAVERAGAKVSSIRLLTDGTIELSFANNDDLSGSEFDRLDAAGLL